MTTFPDFFSDTNSILKTAIAAYLNQEKVTTNVIAPITKSMELESIIGDQHIYNHALF